MKSNIDHCTSCARCSLSSLRWYSTSDGIAPSYLDGAVARSGTTMEGRSLATEMAIFYCTMDIFDPGGRHAR